MNDFTDLSGQTQLVFKDTTTRATYDEKGTPVFCAKDVATVLGYADTVNAIKQHCRGVADAAKAFKARCGVLRTYHWWAGWCRVGRRSRGFLGRGVGLEHQYGAWV